MRPFHGQLLSGFTEPIRFFFTSKRTLLKAWTKLTHFENAPASFWKKLLKTITLMSISLHLKTASGEPIIWHTITELDAITLTVLRVSNVIIVEQKNRFILLYSLSNKTNILNVSGGSMFCFFQSYNSWVKYTKNCDATVACYRLGIAWSHMACATKLRLTLITMCKVNLVYL